MNKFNLKNIYSQYENSTGVLGFDTPSGLGEASDQPTVQLQGEDNESEMISEEDKPSIDFLVKTIDNIKNKIKDGGGQWAKQLWQDALNNPVVSSVVKGIVNKNPILSGVLSFLENTNAIVDVNNPEYPETATKNHFDTIVQTLKDLYQNVVKTSSITELYEKEPKIIKYKKDNEKKNEEDEEDESEKDEKNKKTEKKSPQTSYEKARKKEEGQREKGKKSNPFRVLMGIVGKLLDHGWSSTDIVRHVKRHTKFNKETIQKCVKIVQDRERSKSRLETQSSFNLNSMVKKAQSDISEDLGTYSVKAEFQKRSTRELMMRLFYLSECKNFDSSSENWEKGDISSVESELILVKSALAKRGYTQEDINHMSEKIKTKPYYPYNEIVENNLEK